MLDKLQTEAAKLFAEVGRLTMLREAVDAELAAAKDRVRALNLAVSVVSANVEAAK